MNALAAAQHVGLLRTLAARHPRRATSHLGVGLAIAPAILGLGMAAHLVLLGER